jgi:hypothetical protein
MGLIDRLTRIFRPAPKPVDRPHQGGGAPDAEALYAKLDALKKATGAPERINDTDEWKLHAGFGRVLVKTAMADGKLSTAEAEALADIADQRYGPGGDRVPNDAPLLAYPEATNQIGHLLDAPSEAARAWWAKVVERDGVVTLDDARELGKILLADGKLTREDYEFASHVTRQGGEFTNISFTDDAVRFLSYLGSTDKGLAQDKNDPRRSLDEHQRAIVAEALELTRKMTSGR